MPCPNCGGKLLIENPSNWKTRCPVCEHLQVVEKQHELRISNDRLSHIHMLFMKYVKQFKKTRLIAHIAWQREKFARDFFDNYQAFDMSRFVTYNYLIKHLMIEGFEGTLDANSQNTVELVREFDRFINLRTDEIYLKEGSEMVTDMPFSPESLTIDEKLSPRFKIICTEDFISLSRTFQTTNVFRGGR